MKLHCIFLTTPTSTPNIPGLNVRPETLMTLQENLDQTLEDISTDTDFLNGTQVTQETDQKLTNGISGS